MKSPQRLANRDVKRMSEAKKISIGAFVAAKLDAGKRRVAKTRKRGSYGAIYPETAKAVLAEYPGLLPAERSMVFDLLKADAADQTHKVGLTMSLRQASRILVIPAIAKHQR